MITNKELREIVAESLDISRDDSSLDESYVAQEKKFSFTSESLSKETIDTHLELYKHYLEQLNVTSAKLDTVDRKTADASHSEFRSLKGDEVFNLNAVYLHELYFANVCDRYSEVTIDSLAFMRLERDFGSFDEWQRDFIACGMSGREGWVVTAYSTFLKRFTNFYIDSHNSGILFGCYPIVVLDMWAHSYYRDRLGDKASYIIDMMRSFNWRVIEERFKRAEIIAGALKQ